MATSLGAHVTVSSYYHRNNNGISKYKYKENFIFFGTLVENVPKSRVTRV